MAPNERTPKRQKLSPSEVGSPSDTPYRTLATTDQPQNGSSPPGPDRSSWYNRTWPRKTAPITQVARESISSASNTAQETAAIVKDKVSNASNPSRKSSLALTLGKSTTNKSLPVTATTTTDHAVSNSPRPAKQELSKSASTRTPSISHTSTAESSKEPLSGSRSEPQLVQESVAGEQEAAPAPAPAPAPLSNEAKPIENRSEIVAPRSWIGWLARADDGSAKSSGSVKEGSDPPKQDNIVPSASSAPDAPAPVPIEQLTTDKPKTSEPDRPAQDLSSGQPAIQNQRRSWLPVWSNATAAQSAPSIGSPVTSNKLGDSSAPSVLPDETSQSSSSALAAKKIAGTEADSAVAEPLSGTKSSNAIETHSNTKPSAWIFWSRERPAETTSLKDMPREGELAVSNTDSEIKPRRASLSADKAQAPGSTVVEAVEPPQSGPINKKNHESKLSTDSGKSERRLAPKTTKSQGKNASAIAIEPSEVSTSRTASPVPAKKSYEHLLLPPFRDTLRLPEVPTLLQQLSRLFYSSKEVELKHLELAKDSPKLKNALAIGVHGYFPAPLIRSVIGQPTGTSIKFADMAAKSIQRWTKKRGYECQVKTAALEGEGRISERLDLLWKLLLNWIDEIRKADFVMVACHSQGVPVAIMLVAKLIHFGCISAARVGICAMAGVNMGPFPEFKSRWISGSAGELFEFSDPASKVSVDYLAALDDVLKYGVKLTYVGSIDDQLVSLESSIFAPVSHPHIYRAVSIDSRLHAPDFVSHLVAFALKLRNLGVQDHGLIRELSAPLAGSLYTGEGHSRLYEDGTIYDLAVSFALETNSMPEVALSQRSTTSVGGNPYILPFAMRGILEEDFVKSDLQGEASQLLKQFDEWKPTTKALKDVKFRLEGIRSKL